MGLTRIPIGRHGEWLFKGEVLVPQGRWFRRSAFFVDPRDGILKDASLLAHSLPPANRHGVVAQARGSAGIARGILRLAGEAG